MSSFLSCEWTIPIQTVNLLAQPMLADVIGIVYCHVLKETNFKIAFTMHLLSWKTGLKQVNIQYVKPDVSQAIKYIYINLNIGYGN